MQIRQSYIQRCKIAAHALQALLIFIAWCITIAVYTKGGSSSGAPAWYFALCFLTAPALIYLVMVPMWTRAIRFANAYAFAVVDILYTIFWFSAFIAVAVWISRGVHQGAEDRKLEAGAGNCTAFAYGSESACKLSHAVVDIGVVIFLLFLVTSAISVYTLIQYRKTGTLLTADAHQAYSDPSSAIEAQTKDAWSTDTHEIDNPFHGDGDDDSDDGARAARGRHEEDEYTLLQHGTDTEDGLHPGRPLSWGGGATRVGLGLHEDMGYPGVHQEYAAPSALSPDGYEEYRGGNYSFSSVGRR